MSRATRACRTTAVIAALAVLARLTASAAPASGVGINAVDLKTWLSFIASDELEGRALFGSGMGLAAGFIQAHLAEWGVRPAGDDGSYLQAVRILGVKATSHSTVTVQIGDETRTFTDGDGITFPRNAGGKRRFTIDRVEFTGYGLDAPSIAHRDYDGKNVQRAVVVWIGAEGPKGADESVRRLLSGRSRFATDQMGAAAAISAERPRARTTPAANAAIDFTTVQRLDAPAPPQVTANDAFLSFLFSHARESYDELKRKADAREPLPSFRLDGVKITLKVDVD
jgi:hypothetical protein